MALNEIELNIIKRKIDIIDKLIMLRLKKLDKHIDDENYNYDEEEKKVIECFELFNTYVSEYIN